MVEAWEAAGPLTINPPNHSRTRITPEKSASVYRSSPLGRKTGDALCWSHASRTARRKRARATLR